VLTGDQPSSFVQELAKEIPSEISPESILKEDEIKELPSLFECFLCTDLDKNLLVGVKNNRLPNVQDYTVRPTWDTDEKRDGQQVESAQQTMSVTSSGACLRHLLQRADPIPRFTTIPGDMTVDFFFRRYVVARGPVRTAYERAVNYDLLIGKIPKLTVNEILKTLRSATFERKKEIRVLSRFARISRVYKRILKESAIGRGIVEKAFTWTLVEPFCQTGKRHSKQEYFARPEILIEDHNQLLQVIQKAVPQEVWNSRLISELVFGFLSVELLFRSFRHFRKDLKNLDSFVQGSIRDNFAELIKKQFLGCIDKATAPGQEEQAEWLRKTVIDLEQKPGNKIIDRITAAFAEAHPLRMLIEISE
jgi:hypothetical protein